ncbi:sugar ABC transporter substrate-binding protein [Angustibacter sp. Root456]|nr:sugar ABC transporter substrate-binding protein [Angustibacter sp. Root456]
MILAGALAGCGSSKGDTAAAASSDCKKGDITIGIIPKLGDDPYMTTVRDGMTAESKASGANDTIIYTSPSEATGSAQIPFVQQLISKKVDVIAISGSDLKGAAAELKKARARGIKVLSFDSDVDPSARAIFVNQAKISELGTKMLDSMYDLLGGKGDFAVLSSTQTAVNQNAWIADMKKRLASDPKFKDMKLVAVAYGEEKADVSANRAKELVTTYPNLKGIIIPAGISLPAAATALADRGDLGRVKLTGLAPATLIGKYIQTGDVQDIWWNVTDLGRLSYHVAKGLASCDLTGKKGETFTAGDLGKFTVGEQGEVILGPAKVVTPANLNEFKF